MLDSLSFKPTADTFLNHFKIAARKPDQVLLEQITKAYSHLPYENLTKIIAHKEHNTLTTRPLRFPPQVWDDFLSKGTGGTCFALTYFLYHILHTSGFISYPVMGHRTYGNNTHCALIVLLDKQAYLVDPGFLLNHPLPLSKLEITRHNQGFNTLEIAWSENIFKVHTVDKLKTKFRYAFSDTPTVWDEFEKHWNDSFSWKGMDDIVITFKKDEKQIYIHRDKLLILSPDGQSNAKLTEADIETLGIDKMIVKKAFSHTM
ncbi:arylamine N-acetyltransferase [bacterium]|nr:arylamine N-acetyltransferase [bacterium]